MKSHRLMFRPSIQLGWLLIALALASCQTVQTPQKVTKPALDQPQKVNIDDAIEPIKIAIDLVKKKDYKTAQSILEAYLKKKEDNRVKINLALIYLKTKQIM